jgi:hypothetical protein
VNGLSLAPAEGAAVDANLTEVARQQDDRAPGRTLIDENDRSLSEEDSRYEENDSQSVSGDIDPHLITGGAVDVAGAAGRDE